MTINKHNIIHIFILFALYVQAAPTSHLMKQCEQARSLSQYEQLEKYSAQLIVEARNKHNTHDEAYAYFYNGMAKMFLGDGEQSQRILDQAEDKAIQIGNDSVKALVYNSKGIYHAMAKNNTFVAQQYFFKSLQLAKQVNYDDLQYRVRGNLLTLSHSLGGKFALENAQVVYEYGLKHNNYEQMSMGAYYLATYYLEHHDNAQAEKYIKVALEAYKKHPLEDIAAVYSLYAKVQITQQNYTQAELMVKRAIELAQNYNQPALEIDAYITYAELLEKQGKYAASIDMVKNAMSHADEVGLANKDVDCNQIMARNMEKLGKSREAFTYLQQANTLLNEQAKLNMERVAYEQQVLHEIEQKELDAKLKQEQIAAQRQRLIFLFALVVVLVVLLVVIISTYRHRQVLYKKIVKQNTAAITRQEQLQEQIEHLTRENKLLADNVTDNDDAVPERETTTLNDNKIDTLYAKLCDLMVNDRLYTEAQLTREKMAERLGTNRTYLTAVIKEKTGMSYLQFVNSYRINEAIKILSDKEKINYPLKQIWSDLGFSSPSTFFKVFQQTVGITPSTYRKQFLEVSDELQDEDVE